MNKEAPIGIFDSGTGGLTVARAVKKILPNEDIIYFGDTAHLPYGDKSTATIQSYSVKITDVLLARKCKAILIACNSASAAAFELIKVYTGSKAYVFNVIDPVIDELEQHFTNQKIGLIGTLQTVNSKVFNKKLNSKSIDLEFSSLATPLLVPMIEEGFIHDAISHEIISNYLSDTTLANIKALILGCTHYPIITDEINEYYKNKVVLIDSAELVARSMKEQLEALDLINGQTAGSEQFLVSDITPAFEKAASLFFNKEIQLEKHPLWE